jgi:hypothetical protein
MPRECHASDGSERGLCGSCIQVAVRDPVGNYGLYASSYNRRCWAENLSCHGSWKTWPPIATRLQMIPTLRARRQEVRMGCSRGRLTNRIHTVGDTSGLREAHENGPCLVRVFAIRRNVRPCGRKTPRFTPAPNSRSASNNVYGSKATSARIHIPRGT